MAHANSALVVSDLDFDQIRSSLKDFLSSQSTFLDYDFDGSNMSILLDLLAYNTHYNTYYLNQVANEMFLRSAQLRNNVVDRAQELGYLPTSSRGALVSTDITIVPGDAPASITIPKNTAFTTTVDDNTLTFTNFDEKVVTADANGAYIAKATTLTEGLPVNHRWTVSTSSPVDYVIPNVNVDTSRIVVTLKESAAASAVTTYTQANDVTTVANTSTVFFLEENLDGNYRLYFGDGVLGKKPADGNVIIVDYHICNTVDGNGANSFSFGSTIAGYSDVSVELNVAGEYASGGRAPEGVESIKFNAPKHYEAQNRAVTVNDYERIILAENSDFAAVSVWGGEDHIVPTYGKVFVAVKPAVGTVISQIRKDVLVASLTQRNVLSIEPEIVDAAYLYVVPTVEVNFNPNKTELTAGSIRSNVLTTIDDYQTDELDNFGKVFRYSKFVKEIDLTNTSILSNETTIRIQKQIIPTVGTSTKYTVEFYNAIRDNGDQSNITSTTFTSQGYTCSLKDDADGNIDIVRNAGGSDIVVEANKGTVDYAAGTIVLNSFNPTAVDNSGTLEINAEPASRDVTPLRDQIIQITDTVVTVTEDREV